MRLVPDEQGRAEVMELDPGNTVQDLLDAVDEYLAAHPTGCERCESSCCAKPWAVAVDSVATLRVPCGFPSDLLKSRLNPIRSFRYSILKKEGACPHYVGRRCMVYAARPLVCRLYFCHPMGPGYALLREVAAAGYLARRGDRRNPAHGRREYGARLLDLARYAAARRWLEPEEEAELARLFGAVM